MHVILLLFFLSPPLPLPPSPSLPLPPSFFSPSLSLSRGYIYHTVNIDTGWLVQCNGLLLYHKKSFDEGNSTNYCVRLNEKLEVNKICNLIFHTSCLILHVSYFMFHTSIPHCLVLCTCTYSHTSNFQTFNPSFQETETLSCDIPQLEAHTTLFFISDGLRLYWIYVLKQHEAVSTGTGGSSGDKTKIHNVYLQVLNVNVSVLICTCII